MYMKKLLEISDLQMCVNGTQLLNIGSLCFYEGVSVFLCGTSASGKTLLLKAIAKKVKYRGKIHRQGKTEVVFDRNVFYTNSVEDELKYILLEEEDKKLVSTFLSKKLLKKDPNAISLEEKKLLLFCHAIVAHPDLIFVDEVLSFLNEKNRKKVYDYVKKNKITLVVVSKNIEEALQTDYMIVMDQGKVAMEGKTLQVLMKEKILKRLGVGLPFYVDLSLQLKLYGLLEDIYLTKEEMVGALWK